MLMCKARLCVIWSKSGPVLNSAKSMLHPEELWEQFANYSSCQRLHITGRKGKTRPAG
jgi:hypothetical protein